MINLPVELWFEILDRPEIKGLSGILRLVCKEWNNYLIFKGITKTDKREAVRTIPLIQYSVSKLFFEEETICSYAARGGHLDVLKWTYANGAILDVWICQNASEGGHLDVLKWARSKGVDWDCANWTGSTCAKAAGGGT